MSHHIFCSAGEQEISCLQDVIKVLQKSLITGSIEDKLVLDVRRAFIVKDALREAKKEKFNPKRLIKVLRYYVYVCVLYLKSKCFRYCIGSIYCSRGHRPWWS